MTDTKSEVVTEENLRPLRARIDEIDLVLLRLFSERSEVANEIGRIKNQLGQPIYVPSREKEVLDQVIAANTGPLSTEAIRRIFERIIDETRALERQKYQEGS